MNKILIITALVLLSLPLVAGEWNQYYFRFEVRDTAQIASLTKLISIDKVAGKQVWAYANDREWELFSRLGYEPQILPSPAGLHPAAMAASLSELREWDTYPTYDAYVAMMNSFAADHPDLCQIVNAGTTVDGRSILIARISDNVGTHEKEPEVLFTSTMHGDELTGYILMLRLIDTLLNGYGTDPRLTGLVDNMELWIGPNTNPDGTYYGGNDTVSGARRYNANGVDLNRNFPDADGSLNGTIQPETQAMMDLANAHHFVFGANFHGGAEVVNYPWDHTYTEHPDDAWYYASSLVYAASAQANGPSGYFTGISSDGVTNGADWYVIDGGRQDWMNYTAHAREVTIEVSNTKAPPASQMPNFWNYNHDALLSYLEESLLGIHGTVTDLGGTPLDATITIDGHDNSYSVVETDPFHGDFYRYLSPGTYALTATTSGYDPKTVYATVTADAQTPLTIVFDPFESPTLTWTPGSFEQQLGPDETATQTLTIGNAGNETLAYTVSKPTGEMNLLDESFESGSLPAGWSQEYVNGSVDWEFLSGGHNGHPASAYDGSYNARLYYNSSYNNYATKLITPALDLDSASSATLSFWHAQEVWAGDQDELKVYYRTSPTNPWSQLAHYTASIADWTQETILLPSPADACQIAFEGITDYGYGVCLDNVVVTANNPVTVDWLTVNGGDSHSGSISFGEADQNISIGFNSSSLGEGIYTSHLSVLSNDPQNTSFNIPVQLTVTAGSLDIPQATITTTGPNTVRISWNQVSGASSYQVWSCAEPYGTYTLLGTTPDLYWDHNVSAQQMRFYKVIASGQFSKSGVKN
jgi:hypothetical protein